MSDADDLPAISRLFRDLQSIVDDIHDFNVLLYIHGFLTGWIERVEEQMKKEELNER